MSFWLDNVWYGNDQPIGTTRDWIVGMLGVIGLISVLFVLFGW